MLEGRHTKHTECKSIAAIQCIQSLIQYSVIQYHTVQCHTVSYSLIQSRTVQCHTVLYSSVIQSRTVQCHAECMVINAGTLRLTCSMLEQQS